jgi:hypothetical protein
MTEPRAILSYAQPGGSSADAASDRDVFTFPSPPTLRQTALLITLFVICTAGAVMVAGLTVDAGLHDGRDRGARLVMGTVALALISGIAFHGWRELARLRRFGREDVRLEVSGANLLAWAPQAWGEKPRAIDVEEISSVNRAQREPRRQRRARFRDPRLPSRVVYRVLDDPRRRRRSRRHQPDRRRPESSDPAREGSRRRRGGRW